MSGNARKYQKMCINHLKNKHLFFKMSSEFDFEISSSESEIDDFELEDNEEISKLCVLLNVHGTVKAIVDAIDCLQKNNIESILYILENGSYPAYRKYIEDNILKQTYNCVAVRYHFEENGSITLLR